MRHDSGCSCGGGGGGYARRTFEEGFFDELQYEKGKSAAPKQTAAGSGGVSGTGVVSAVPVVNFMCLTHFPFKVTAMPAFHADSLKRVAHLVLASQAFVSPIKEVFLVGHTDERGTDTVNVNYGERRAKDVRTRLVAQLNTLQTGLAAKVTIHALTRGEFAPLRPHTNPANADFNRRVEVFLPRTCQTFFAQLDLRTLPGAAIVGVPAHPNVWDKPKREAQVLLVVQELQARRAKRARAAAEFARALGPQNAITAARNSTLHAAVVALSKLQLELFREYFPGAQGGINFAALRTCFERFANGELRGPHAALPKGIGEPDGEGYFLFAEFAVMCIESLIDANEWRKALSSLVMSQEIFMHIYHPVPAAPPPVGAPLPAKRWPPKTALGPYDALNFKPVGGAVLRGVGQSDSARKNALRAKYNNMTFLQLRRAYAENLLRAQNMR
jgi:outer membrane protein OmpA-like peptidoglycan-associated protein